MFRFMMFLLRSLLLLSIMFSMGNADDRSRCPRDWRKSGSRCFKFFSRSVNWVTAERNCQSLGGNLASVHNQVENDLLLSLVPGSTRCWIGGHDGEQNGQWLWSDGSSFGYTNWCSGEPSSGSEHCLEINWTSNRCWNNVGCSSTMGYLCAKDLGCRN
ncbi:ladderlectin-like isoform X1 [Danio aesculapii]|uniref:ladderlectin-like isoform X1 n=2 Tax=Danio aesculapii TaxID=1142201 RepID=UPI0024BF2DF6|nr:ladderlectin-like isoform X1 [Danio aesculapii]